MAVIQNVKKVDDFIPLNRILVSCTNKAGLVSNEGVDDALDPRGLLGALTELNPNILFISTGNTYAVIRDAGLPVVEMSTYTGYPEMKTGLVKTLHPRIHAGILGHNHTPDDKTFMKDHDIPPIDAVIVNFYDLDKELDTGASFEAIRQAIDIGGPTMCHNARKAFISTALLVDPQKYTAFLAHVKENDGAVSLAYRFSLAQQASIVLTEVMEKVNKVFQRTTYEDLLKSYEII